MRNYISTPARDLFIRLAKSIRNAYLYRIIGSDEPEGVIVFSTGEKFYYSRNPMTQNWDLDTFELFDESLGNQLREAENQDEMQWILDQLTK